MMQVLYLLALEYIQLRNTFSTLQDTVAHSHLLGFVALLDCLNMFQNELYKYT